MTSQTGTRFPRVLRHAEAAHAPSQSRYVGIAVFLAIVTAIEVVAYYIDMPKALLVVLLVFLAAIKFSTVAALFMHLRFDGRLLVFIFCTGLALAGFAFTIVVFSIRAIH